MVELPVGPEGGRDSEAAPGKSGERVAKFLARAGICSRREAERLIGAGRIKVDGTVLTSPAINVSAGNVVTFDDKPVATPDKMRLWLYHKPKGLITSHRDPQGRPTVFAALPKDLPRVISIGRLDYNSEGLLLLTNDGALARRLELPATGWVRRYRARVFGRPAVEALARLGHGIAIDDVKYGPIEASIDTQKGDNCWLIITLREGKNREVRRVLEHLGHQVSRLIRIAYGPFQLGHLDPGEVREVPPKVLREQLGLTSPGTARKQVRANRRR